MRDPTKSRSSVPGQPNNSLKPWQTTRIPVKTCGTNGLRPWKDTRAFG